MVALADWVASEYEKWEHGMKRKEEERMNELELIWSEREEERTNAINSVQKIICITGSPIKT